MPFLLLDDATQEAQRRLQEFGQGLLQPLGQTIEQAGQTVQPGPQVVPPGAAIPNAQAATQRLQDYGSSLLQPLTQQAPVQIAEQPGGIQDITQRLQDHGQQMLNQATQQVQQAQTQLLQLPQQGQLFGPGAQDQAQQQAQNQVIQTQPDLSPGGDLRTFARQAAQKAGIDPDIFVRQIEQESGFNPTAKSPAGALGIAQFMPETARGVGVDPTDPYASLIAAAKEDAQKLAQYGGDWSKTLAAYNAGPGAVAQYGGVPPFAETQSYVKTILGDRNPIRAVQQGAQNVVQGAQAAVGQAQQAASNILPAVSQFGDKQLTAAEAYAACGPAAAVRFAEMVGRNPTLREATDLAAQVGWTPGGGMAGLGSESALFDKMQIPHRMVGADWNALAKEAQSGNPVTISTPGHYFTADGYDPNTGAFHVGSSGTDLRGGAEWMTPDQMQARMGQLQGGMAVDNPQVPGPSPLANPVQAAQQGLGNLVQGARQGLQDITAAPLPGVNRSLNQAAQDVSGFMSPVTNFVGQQNQRAREGYQQYGLDQGTVGQMLNADFNDPASVRRALIGADPYAAIVQEGVPSIVQGVQNRDVGQAAGGALQTVLGGVSLLPGAGGATRAATEAGAPGFLQAAGDVLRSRQSTQDLSTLEDLLSQPGLSAAVRAPLEDLVTRQRAQAIPRFAAGLAGAVGGGYAGNATAPSDAEFRDRVARVIAGAGIGAGLATGAAGLATGGGPLEQSVLQSLHSAGVIAGPARTAPLRGPIAEAVDFTKQSILTNPATHIANVIGNTIELGRQPIALAMGGRGDDALAGLISVARALPDATGNALAALGGRQAATLASAAGTIPRRAPVFRALSAADAFTRTLGEYQGMASEASRLLREAGISASDPGAAAYLATHAADLYAQGARAGAQSVFGRVASSASGTSVLDNIFKTYANAKEGLLNSPRLGDQAMGALMDFFVPFSGVPVQMLEIGLNRLPGAAQATGAVRAISALKAGNVAEAQRAMGETGLETALQLMIAKQVGDGNITGPDDPEHPNSVRLGGNWVSMNEWGAYALPMQIMASFADGYEKAGRDVLPSGAGANDLQQVADYYGPRFAGALNASLKPFQQGIPGENLLRLLNNIGQGGTTAGALGLAQDAINRITVPGAARFVENLTDPVTREVNRKGIQSLWEGPMSNWPELAQQLPAKIDPTTGEALQKSRTGAGILVGVQQDVASPITQEADRLNKAGYKSVNPPSMTSDTVSYQGAQVKLSPDEQRAVAQATGHILGNFASRLSESDYQESSDDRKAKLMQAYINAASDARLKAWISLVGPDQARTRLIAAQRTAGRLNTQATPPAVVPPFLSSSSLSAQEQAQAQAAA